MVFESKRKIQDEQTDEKLRTQTFRFTNQFKSDDGDEAAYFNDNEGDDIYDDFIEEEIDTESYRSPPKNVQKMQLKRDTGPQEVPSDTEPYKKIRGSQNEVQEMVGTPLSKPPKAPPRVNMKNVFKSPVNEIFKTSKAKEEYKDPVLDKRHSEPVKLMKKELGPCENAGMAEAKRDNGHVFGYDFGAESETLAKDSHQRSIAEQAIQKMRSEYTKDSLLNRPYSPPFMK